MGCDIHLFGEKKVNGVWQAIKGEYTLVCSYRHMSEERQAMLDRGERPHWAETEQELRENIEGIKNTMQRYIERGDVLNCLYSDRNYDVFAILADVRNGRGFAGVPTGEGFNPISMPKGLPEDVSAEIKQKFDEWEEDGHSHSWLTLRELMEYDWDQGTVHYGVVTENEYRTFKEKGQPESWCGDVGGRSVVILTNEKMDSLLAGDLSREEGKSYYTRVEWKSTYMDSARCFYNAVVPKMQALAGDDPDSVRLVFWFDN